MTKTKLKGNEINTNGTLPTVGSSAKDFQLVATNLSTQTLADLALASL
jgi:thiol peroxidase